LLFGLVFACVLCGLFADPLLSRRSFAGRDFARYFLPVEQAVHEAWSRGRAPLWMPEASFGRPLAANPNIGAFYPPRIAMSALPLSTALKLFPVFHLWVAGFGAFLLARFFGVSAFGAGVAAATYALGGPALAEIDFFNIIPGFALLPFVLWTAGRFARRPSSVAAAAFGLAWGFDLLAGDVLTAGLAIAGAVLLTLEEGAHGRGRAVLGLLGASVPGFLVAGIQLLPAFLVFPSTVRSLTTFSLKKALDWSVPPWRLAELFVAFPFGKGAVVWGDLLWSGRTTGFFGTLYSGAFAVIALLCVRPPRSTRPFFYGFAAFSLALSMFGFFMPESLLALPSPIPLRYPEKLIVGFELVCALAAGFGLDSFRKRGARAFAIWPLAVGLLLLFSGFVASRDREAVAALAQSAWTSAPNLASLGAQWLPRILARAAVPWLVLAGLFFLWTPERRRPLEVAVVLFVLADLGLLARSVAPTVASALVFTPPPMARLVRRIDQEGRYGFMPLQDYVFPVPSADPLNEPQEPPLDVARRDLSGLAGVPFGMTYTFNIDYDLSDFYRVELARRELFRDNGDWPGAAGYVASFGGRSAVLMPGELLMGFSRTVRTLGPRALVANPRALPAIRFAEDVLEVPDAAEAYRVVHGREVDLAATTVIETGRRARYRLAPGQIRVTSLAREEVELETRTDSPGRILFLRAYWPFREVLLDGRPEAFSPANLCVTSIAVPAGVHRIRIRETLPGGIAGPGVTAAGVLALVFLARPRRPESLRPDALIPGPSPPA
jgi:hypothetical protein